jgi:hypothetical protein
VSGRKTGVFDKQKRIRAKKNRKMSINRNAPIIITRYSSSYKVFSVLQFLFRIWTLTLKLSHEEDYSNQQMKWKQIKMILCFYTDAIFVSG